MNVEPFKSLTNNDAEVYDSDACPSDVDVMIVHAYTKISQKFGFLHNVLHLDAKQLKDKAKLLCEYMLL